jgi:hypothetical protein
LLGFLWLPHWLWLGGNEGSFGVGKQVELPFDWNIRSSRENKPKTEAGQLVVCECVKCGEQDFLGDLLIVLIFADIMLGYVVREGVRVDCDEGVEKYPQLRCGEHRRSIRKDSVERGHAQLLKLFFANTLGLILLLLPLELLLALRRCPSLMFFLMLRSVLFVLALVLFGFGLRLGFCDRRNDRRRTGCLSSRRAGVMHRAIGASANSEGFTYVLAEDDDC